jgi:hypothetical protein
MSQEHHQGSIPSSIMSPWLSSSFAVKAKRPAGYLNVDLEIGSSSSLDCLAEEMGNTVLVLHSGHGAGRERLLCLESVLWPNTPDAAARELCRAVERLSPSARGVWERARRREFNVGFELRTGLRAVQVILQPETVRRIVALGGTIAFTCYRDDNSEQASAANGSQPIRPRKKRTSPAAGSRRSRSSSAE